MFARIIDLLLICVAIAGAVWTYQIKHEAESSANRIKSVQAQIAAQNRKIVLLEADWAIETAPGRLEGLAGRFEDQLELRRMESSQIATRDELPRLRQAPSARDGETWAARNDNTITGSIGELIEREGGR
ncbi:MAG: hypothetical protein OXR62_05650 [Ahrensia sp.]|nr:hypothetical protein [Ahrensia sp.]